MSRTLSDVSPHVPIITKQFACKPNRLQMGWTETENKYAFNRTHNTPIKAKKMQIDCIVSYWENGL